MKNFFKAYYVKIFWLLVSGFVMAALWYSPFTHSFRSFLKVGSFTACMWVFLWLGNSYTSDLVSRRISWTEQPARRFWVGMLVMVVYSLSIIAVLIVFFEVFVGLNISGDLASTLLSALIITTVISLFMHSWSFLQNWREAAVNAERLQRESIKAQYESLKNQVNPHFLFNSLNALTNLVYEDQEKAVKFIKQLSEVYRYVLDTRDKEVVPLEDELKFLKAYVFLQQIRFGEKMRMDIQLSESKSQVAPLVLQMLIENAIKHNVCAADQPLSIRLFQDNGYLVVENSLQRKTVLQEDSPGIGLENIRRRYGFLSEKKVEVMETQNKFIVKLPVLK